ncbi:MAG: carboxypeptidase regulatory-like domain-containing protein [Candidatus Riflebacteria bacterium]|nr:carboxypeptidase regulatory-like domain-containing protein [Candidatus Riflebacteria bacterium]
MKNISINTAVNYKVAMFAGIILLLSGIFGCEHDKNILRGSVSGRVLDENGNRIGNAKLMSHRSLYSAESDKNGKYSFTSLDSGVHILSVEHEGFKSASKTVSIENGEEKDGIDFQLTPLSGKLSWQIFSRGYDSVTIDISASEKMSCAVIYQGYAQPQMRTPQTSFSADSRVVISPLRTNMDYSFFVEGKTEDGRLYVSASGTFRPYPQGDLPGGPVTPGNVRASATREGARIAWDYDGEDPLTGFRVFRAINDSELKQWQDESFVFGTQRFLIDDFALPGVLTRYAIQAVDLDGNVSSISSEIAFLPPGTMQSDAVWLKKYSPLELSGDIIIPENIKLTIEPGVVVRVSETDGYQGGMDTMKCELTVEGTIKLGQPGNEPVRFLSASSLPDQKRWCGIRIKSLKTQPPSQIDSLETANAEYGLMVSDSPIDISYFAAKYCKTGLILQGASGTYLTSISAEECDTGLFAEGNLNCQISNVRCIGGETGISFSGNRSMNLSMFDIRGTSETGLDISDTASPTVRNGVILSQRLGMKIRSAAGDFQYMTISALNGILIDGASKPELRNNVIVNQLSPDTGIGIEERITGRSYPYNNISGFMKAVSECDQDGAPILNIDPEFIGGNLENFDYHIRPGSILKSASDRRTEIGAYGF